MIRKAITTFLVLILGPGVALSASDDFRIRQQIGIDVTPPTVPAGVTTTPVATTQINIVWGTSTDSGVGLSGYRVYRDGVQIATTTVTNYSDTGLSASTTYSYNIAAFDSFFNTSALTPTTSATTLAPPPPPEPIFGSSDLELVPIELTIDAVQVTVADTEATISFLTPSFATAAVIYGVTPQYEIGSLASGIFEKDHRFTLTDLEPNRQYFFEITVTNQRGESVYYDASFITKALVDIVPPANVSNFTAVADGEDVELSWENPPERDFDRVRIIGNHRFYPLDMNDGELLYEGDREFYRHEWVYPENDRMYYSIFAIDEEGNQSSGAIAHVRWVAPAPPGSAAFDPLLPPQTNVVPGVDQAGVPVVIDGYTLSFDDLEFIQNARLRQGLQATIDLDPNQNFTVRLPYDRVPERLKTLTVTLTDPEDPTRTFSFLLRINERKTHYEATIGALGRHAEFPLEFTLFDLGTRELYSFTGYISTVPETAQAYADAVPTPVEQAITVFSRWWWWLIILLLLLMAYWLMKD